MNLKGLRGSLAEILRVPLSGIKTVSKSELAESPKIPAEKVPPIEVSRAVQYSTRHLKPLEITPGFLDELTS